ncbi:MAG: hypothetical protein KIT57_05915 [Blastocatellales bacterium]|nr:hypothetical protein [Blastocatellales bacterium]
MICAVPDPHLERWLLIDSGAFKKVLGKGCQAPDQKCERDRYKKLLLNAICNAGRTPLIGGLEHTEDIVNAMDLANLKMVDDSFGKLLKALERVLKAPKGRKICSLVRERQGRSRNTSEP